MASSPRLREAASQLEWILSSRLSSDLLRKSATKLLRNGRQPWVFALHLLRRLDESATQPDLISLGAVQDTLARHRSAWQHALSVLLEVQLRRLRVDAALMAVAIHACRQRWRQAFALLADATRRSLDSNVARSSSILACGVAQQWRRALAILTDSSTSAQRIPCSAATYSSAMVAMEEATQWQHALEILRVALEEVVPDVVLFSAGISATEAAGGRWQHALQLMQDAKGWQIQVNVVMLSAALSALEKGSQWHSALSLMASFQGPVDAIACNAAVNACKQGTSWELAMHFACCGATRHGKNAAAQSLAAGHRWQRCLKLLADLPSGDVVAENAMQIACEAAHRPWPMPRFVSKHMTLQEVMARIEMEESSARPVPDVLLRHLAKVQREAVPAKDGQLGQLPTRLMLSWKCLRFVP